MREEKGKKTLTAEIVKEIVMCDVIKIRLKRKDEKISGKGNT